MLNFFIFHYVFNSKFNEINAFDHWVMQVEIQLFLDDFGYWKDVIFSTRCIV